jgi:nucleolar protein 15
MEMSRHSSSDKGVANKRKAEKVQQQEEEEMSSGNEKDIEQVKGNSKKHVQAPEKKQKISSLMRELEREFASSDDDEDSDDLEDGEDENQKLVDELDDRSESDDGGVEQDFPKVSYDIPLDTKVRHQLQVAQKKLSEPAEPERSRVVYIGHIPFGFFEEQMRMFFTQFGKITKLRLSRNKKTGNSKHYAFIEFEDPDVAEIVADTMNNYILYHRRLVCRIVPREKLHPLTFKNANKPFQKVDWHKIEQERHNQSKSVARQEKIVNRLLEKEQKKRMKLEELGIDYVFTGYMGAKKALEKKQRQGKKKDNAGGNMTPKKGQSAASQASDATPDLKQQKSLKKRQNAEQLVEAKKDSGSKEKEKPATKKVGSEIDRTKKRIVTSARPLLKMAKRVKA